MTCKCGSNVEFTLVEDMYSKIFLLECECPNCGHTSHGQGKTVEEALMAAKRDWAKKGRKSAKRKRS